MPSSSTVVHDDAVLAVDTLDAEAEPRFEQWLREAASSVGGAVTQHEAVGIQIRKYYEVSSKGDDPSLDAAELNSELTSLSSFLPLLQSTRPTKSVQLAREGIVERLQELITARWPEAQLEAEVFGSSFTGMHTSSSDIDIVLLDPALPLGNAQAKDGPRPEWHDVKVLAKYLRTHAGAEGFKDVHAIPSASVPIVTLRMGNVPRLAGVKVDIAINNRFGIA